VQSLFPIGSYVTLSDGSTARVLRRNGAKFCHPIVRIVVDSHGKEIPENSTSAVIDLSTAGLDVVRSLPNPGSDAVDLSMRILRMSEDCAEDEADGGLGKGLVNSSSEEAFRALSSVAANSANLDESIASLEHYSESEQRKAFEALDILDNSAQIIARANQAKRDESRVALRTVVTVCLADPRYPIVNLDSGRLVRVMTRDVSTRGVSFVCPETLPQERILIGIHVNETTTRWFLGDVVRAREVAETGFWEHGVVFRQAVTV
jgi:hypothetical protein